MQELTGISWKRLWSIVYEWSESRNKPKKKMMQTTLHPCSLPVWMYKCNETWIMGSYQDWKVIRDAGETRQIECVPKDFSKAEDQHYRVKTTKGTIFFMSPCGAKIFCTEMITTESLSMLFHSLSKWIPIVKDRLKIILEEKDKQHEMWKHPLSGKNGPNIINASVCAEYNDWFLNLIHMNWCNIETAKRYWHEYWIIFTVARPPMPEAEIFGVDEQPRVAEYIILYDFACGALSSLRARMKYMAKHGIEVPQCVKAWAGSSKFIIDKFHFKTHKGVIPCVIIEHVNLDQVLMSNNLIPSNNCREAVFRALQSILLQRGSTWRSEWRETNFTGFCQHTEAGTELQGME